MKKIIGLGILTMLMMCCEIGPRQASASNVAVSHPNDIGSGDVVVDIINKNGMEFHIYHSYTSVFVINQTKELLEVELLRKQIEQINK